MTLSKYRPDIDGLRAIAVTLVVIHHAFPQYLPSGFIGVDIFFVISGYLISTIIFQNLENGTFSFIDFYQRRIKRIFPALCLVLMACLVYGWFSLLPADYKALGKHTLAGAAFVANFALWQESGYFDINSQLKPLLHLWSLGIEEQYYIFWPLIVWLAWQRKFNLFKISLALLVLSFAANIYIVQTNTVAAFFAPWARFWELLTGSVLAYSQLHPAVARNSSEIYKNSFKSALYNKQVLAGLGATLLLVGAIFIHTERQFPGFWVLLPVLGAAGLIAAGPQAWLNRVLLSNRLFVGVGLISYPLYLWHWPLLVFAKQSAIGEVNNSTLLAAIALSFVLAWITYKLIERPIRFGKSSSKTKVIALVVAAGLTAYAGFNIYKRDGLSFRIPAVLQKIAAFENDYAVNSNIECLVPPNADKNSIIPSQCYQKAASADALKRKSILLWGDSYAWSIYAGLNNVVKSRSVVPSDVFLLSKAGCPPLVKIAKTYVSECKQHNLQVLQAIKTEKYDQVLMFARWNHWAYQSDGYLDDLQASIDALKQTGVKNIYLLGPAPEWLPGLQAVLIKHALRDKPAHRLADRIKEGVAINPTLDGQLRKIAAEKQVNYISLLDILCNAEGCVTKSGNDPEELIGYDDGHFSRKGGAYIAKQFPVVFFTGIAD